MSEHPLAVLAILGAVVAASEWLAHHTALRHLGTALMVIIVGAVLANVGIIAPGSSGLGLYGGIFGLVAPMAIFMLLLEVNLRELRAAGGPMLLMFAVGSGATAVGVAAVLWLTDMPAQLGEMSAALGGMFVATYTGVSVNFNAVALHFGVVEEGTLYTGAVAVDNIMTAAWMVATLTLPKLLHGALPRARGASAGMRRAAQAMRDVHDSETTTPLELGILLAGAAATLWLSNATAAWLGDLGIPVPGILILTTVALVLAQFPAVAALRGRRVLGMFGLYLFLAAIGAHAEMAALADLGRLGGVLFLFVAITVVVHGTLIYGAGWALRQDWDVVSVASQANIGGQTTAMALARSLGRNDLFLPAILVGSLGNGAGTYLGFLAAAALT